MATQRIKGIKALLAKLQERAATVEHTHVCEERRLFDTDAYMITARHNGMLVTLAQDDCRQTAYDLAFQYIDALCAVQLREERAQYETESTRLVEQLYALAARTQYTDIIEKVTGTRYTVTAQRHNFRVVLGSSAKRLNAYRRAVERL